MLIVVGYWSGEDLVCPNCAHKTDIKTLTSIGGDDEVLIAHDRCVGCGGVYFGQGLWQQPQA